MVLSLSTPVPMPADWTHVYAVLKKAWEAGAEDAIPASPVTLILAGAAFSNASDIRKRWVELIDWANVFGFSENLAQLCRHLHYLTSRKLSLEVTGGRTSVSSFMSPKKDIPKKPYQKYSRIFEKIGR